MPEDGTEREKIFPDRSEHLETANAVISMAQKQQFRRLPAFLKKKALGKDRATADPC